MKPLPAILCLSLPILAAAMGKATVPILTVAQLLGNLSRAGFGWRDIGKRQC